MSKAERLIEMMITINAKRDFTVGELADEFGVSKRTILRDLQSLESVGFPLYSEVGAAGGYHVLKERMLPPITFTENEAKALFFAYQSLAFYRDLPFEQETISALKKFLNFLPTDVQYSITQIQNKIVFWTPDRHCNSPLLKKLLDIVVNNLAATITYAAQYEESIRTIQPIGLYSMNGLWYCPAYCLKSNSIREFRVDRMKEISPTTLAADVKRPTMTSIHEYLENLEKGNDYHIRIELTDIGVKRCEAEFLLARGLHILENGGYIDMNIQKSTIEWLADFLLPFGENATISEPVELIDMMKKNVENLYSIYHPVQ